jgi:hypothetical protein
MAYIVRVESAKGKVRFAGVSDGPPVTKREDAHRFPSKQEAGGAARGIRAAIPSSCSVTVEDADHPHPFTVEEA